MIRKIPFSLLIKISITALLLGALFKSVTSEKLFMAFTNITVPCVIMMLVCFWTIQLLMAQRWSFILQSHAYFFPFFSLVRSVFIGQLFNQGLPSSIGGDAYRVMSTHQNGVPLSLALNSVLLERLIGILSLGCLGLIVTPFQYSFILKSPLLWPTVFLFLLILGIFLFLTVLNYIPISKLLHYRFISYIQPFIELVQKIAQQKPLLKSAVLTSTIISFLSVVNCIILLKDLNIPLTFLQSYLIFPLAFMIIGLPFSLGGWGIREGALIFLMGIFGIEYEQALAFSILYGFIQLLSALPGFIFWLLAFKKTPVASKSLAEPTLSR